MNLVVVPVYNEAQTLKGVLEKIRYFHEGDILAVDDGSTDGSSDILEERKDIKVLRHPGNLGYGRSIIDGLDYAVTRGYKKVVTIDCDEQHEPRLIPAMFREVGDLDTLSGSRYLKPGPADDNPPEDRRSINVKITEIINDITGFNLTDSFCGFKCYRTRSLKKLQLDEPGYAQPLQFWIQAKRFGLTVGEIATPLIYKNLNRSFGGALDSPDLRLMYYKRVIERELKRWSISLPSALTRTT